MSAVARAERIGRIARSAGSTNMEARTMRIGISLGGLILLLLIVWLLFGR